VTPPTLVELVTTRPSLLFCQHRLLLSVTLVVVLRATQVVALPTTVLL
jgi:hypothetical protein